MIKDKSHEIHMWQQDSELELSEDVQANNINIDSWLKLYKRVNFIS